MSLWELMINNGIKSHTITEVKQYLCGWNINRDKCGCDSGVKCGCDSGVKRE